MAKASIFPTSRDARFCAAKLDRRDTPPAPPLWNAVNTLVYANPLYDMAGRLSGAMNVLLDITDTRRVEAAVKVSEIRYRRLFEMAKDGILILDAESARITDANPFIAELLGYSHADLIGTELWQIGLFKDVDESKAAMRELQENR